MKVYRPKMGRIAIPRATLAFAFAGNSAFATTAVQKCAAYLSTLSATEDPVAAIERVLDRQYRKTVHAHPDRTTDWNIPYWLLLAIWLPGKPVASLFATQDTTLRSLITFEAIGIGKELAHYLVGPTYHPFMEEPEAIRLASYMLTRIKSYVPGCGGASDFLVLRNDGDCQFVSSPEIEQVEQASEEFDRQSRALFFSAADNQLSDADFEMKLFEFAQWMKGKRYVWREMKRFYESIGFNPAAQPSPQYPTPDPSLPQPSPESPEGSGGS